MKFDELSKRVIGCAIEVHRHLGPGLLESASEQCLAREFSIANIAFEIQKPLPVEYKDVKLNCGYRIDLFVENKLILEIKAIEKLLPIHEAQILTYMKLTKAPVGLLINFNVELLKNGITRFVL
jgi:GxxExxY protein